MNPDPFAWLAQYEPTDDDFLYHDRLQTHVRGIEYDFNRRDGRLLMAEHCCTDMTGAIEMFTAIDPHVRIVRTIAGDVPDTIYMRDDFGNWRAA